MVNEENQGVVDGYWRDAEQTLSGLGDEDYELLAVANGAVDTVWDRHVFDHAETFGGSEIRFARSLSAAVLARLLGVEYAALASVASAEIPASGDSVLDEGLGRARQEALDTFSSELLGPAQVEEHLVYAKPLLLDSPLPIGAVILAGRQPIEERQQRLLDGYIRHLDTRLNLAEELLKLRRANFELGFELKKLKGELAVPEPEPSTTRVPVPDNLAESMAQLARTVPSVELFGISLSTEHFEDFCRNFHRLTNQYLGILEKAPNLYLDVPNGIDAKDDDKRSAPYLKLLEIMGSLRQAARLLLHTTADDLVMYTAGGRAPTFADLTRIARDRAEDQTTQKILDIMNDQGEEVELDEISARHHPYEFRAANIGEVFALLGLEQTVKATTPESYQELRKKILQSLPGYQAARAYLLSYDRFEDVPLKGVDRTQSPDAEQLLLLREQAPSFGVLLAAFGGG
jgi:hypothetical protein